MCSCEDADPPAFWNEAWVKARKQHKCYECCGLVHPGERYRRVSGKWDGEVESYAFCAKCARFQQAFFEAEGCHAPLGEARSEARECMSYEPEFAKRLLNALRAQRKKAA